MSYLQFLPIAIFIGLQATFMMIIEPSAGFVSWISFQAWAMYFLAGCTPTMGLKTLVGYFFGMIASVAIMEGAGAFGAMGIGNSINLYLAVFLVVVLVISAEKVPGIDFVPAWFIGAGVFFGLMNLDTFAQGATTFDMYLQCTAKLMWSCAVGLVFGYVTVTCRAWYEKKYIEGDTTVVNAVGEEIKVLS
jgi:hypothetical protein